MPVSKQASEGSNKPVPYWQSECGRAVVYLGDNLDIMSCMCPGLFHAIVTDPPYGLEFMGKEWDAPWKNDGKIEICDEGTDQSHPFRDGTNRVCYGNNRRRKVDARDQRSEEMGDESKRRYIASGVEYVRDSVLFQSWFLARAEAMMRVARPGAHLLSFGGSRMWHRMTCAVEDAGWEIRDTIMWLYGSGFPKGQDISKAIDKQAGAERPLDNRPGDLPSRQGDGTIYGLAHTGNLTSDEPITEAARQWRGWNTALKPAHEPIILARKPVPGTVAQCVLDHGTGALNIDGCRVGTDQMPLPASDGTFVSNNRSMSGHNTGRVDMGTKTGRWPANIIHDGSNGVVDLFPTEAGGGGGPKVGGGNAIGDVYGGYKCGRSTVGHLDSGSAARFFYTAKADEDDRPHGKRAVAHPTVKPLDLMRYLVRLVCARGGVVLDPFMGSGSTGCAAIAEGMWFVGIEQDEKYADIAVGRLRLALAAAPASEKLVTDREVASKVIERRPPPRKLR